MRSKQLNYLNAHYLMKDDTRSAGKNYCPKCDMMTNSYKVTGFRSKNMKKALFCNECNELVHKPAPFRWDTPSGLEVNIIHSNNFCELVTHDYSQKNPYKEPKLVKHCGKAMNIIEKEKLNNDVIAILLECQTCKQEKILKYYSYKEKCS